MGDLKVVPFGKYKGQPVEVLQADPGYCDWVTQQPNLAEKYPELRTLIINNFTEPTCTPEHNKLQVKFLDVKFVEEIVAYMEREFGWKFYHVRYVWVGEGGELMRRYQLGAKGEDRGEYITDEMKSLHPDMWDRSKTLHRSVRFEYRGIDVLLDKVAIEIKPLLGDDYPAVMRAINSKSSTYNVLLYQSFRSDAIDESVLKAFMLNGGIRAFSFADVEGTGVVDKPWDL